jgi:hypothetical protein
MENFNIEQLEQRLELCVNGWRSQHPDDHCEEN